MTDIYGFYLFFPSEDSRMVGKVCIIGGGPSGLAVLSGFAKMQREGQVKFNDFFPIKLQKSKTTLRH